MTECATLAPQPLQNIGSKTMRSHSSRLPDKQPSVVALDPLLKAASSDEATVVIREAAAEGSGKCGMEGPLWHWERCSGSTMGRSAFLSWVELGVPGWS